MNHRTITHIPTIQYNLIMDKPLRIAVYCRVSSPKYDKEKQTLKIISKKAKIVRMIFDLRLQSYSLGEISSELAKEATPSPDAKPDWSRESIRKILCNGKFVFSWAYRGKYVK